MLVSCKEKSLEYRLNSLHIETDTTKTNIVSTKDFDGGPNKQPSGITSLSGYVTTEGTTTDSIMDGKNLPITAGPGITLKRSDTNITISKIIDADSIIEITGTGTVRPIDSRNGLTLYPTYNPEDRFIYIEPETNRLIGGDIKFMQQLIDSLHLDSLKYIVSWVLKISENNITRSLFKEFPKRQDAFGFYSLKIAERDSCLNTNCAVYTKGVKIDSVIIK